jgi:hypothetical protein
VKVVFEFIVGANRVCIHFLLLKKAWWQFTRCHRRQLQFCSQLLSNRMFPELCPNEVRLCDIFFIMQKPPPSILEETSYGLAIITHADVTFIADRVFPLMLFPDKLYTLLLLSQDQLCIRKVSPSPTILLEEVLLSDLSAPCKNNTLF